MRASTLFAASFVVANLIVGVASAETIDGARAAHGLGPLRLSGELSAMADGHARDLARHSSGRCTMASLNHDGFMQRRGPAGALAENISCGCGTATCAIQQWLRSQGHRANILMRGAGSYGLSSASSSSGVLYWTMELGP